MSNVLSDVIEKIKSMSAEDLVLVREAADEVDGTMRQKRVAASVEKAIWETNEILAGLSSPPFVYVSPEIKLLPGVTVKYSTILKVQERDVLDEMSMLSPTSSNGKVSDVYLSGMLAHALVSYNGEPFGGVELDYDEIGSQLLGNHSEAVEKIVALRDQRSKAISAMPTQVLGVLIDGLRAFQGVVDSACMSEDLGETLGN